MRGIVHFREDLERKAREFECYWMAQREKALDKSDWPLRMEPQDWWEQYVVWITTVENKGYLTKEGVFVKKV